ncbi:MAG: DNA primase [Armatimonadota bacterium]
MDDAREEVRRRTDLAELVSARVPLRRSGKNLVGLCPFHDDHRPSFYVSSDTGRYKCFSCGEAGDIFDWVMKTQGLDFPDALKELASRAGVELKSHTTATSGERVVREQHELAMNVALTVFREQFEQSSAAQHYCRRRGLADPTLAKWQIGYAPDGGEVLAARLRKEGVPLALARELFLVEEDGRNGYYDRFRNRIIFPIRDDRGRLVAFGGRTLGDGQPKYINSSDTPLYTKSRVLYGLDQAKVRFVKSRSATLAEGYLDVIALHEAGVDDAVASLGTSLTSEQAALLARFVERVTLLYDGDDAGRRATERALDVLAESKLAVRVTTPAPDTDPDTLLRKEGAEAVRRLTSSAISAFTFRVRDLELRTAPSDPAFWPDAIALLATAPSEIELEAELVRLASRHPTLRDPRLAQQAIRRDVEAIRGGRPENRRSRAVSDLPVRAVLQPVELAIFGAIANPDLRSGAWPILDLASMLPTLEGQVLARNLQGVFGNTPPEGPLSEWIARLGSREQEVFSNAMLDMRAQNVTREQVQDSEAFIRRRNRELAVSRKRQRGVGNDEDARRAIAELREIKADTGPNKDSRGVLE